MLRSSLSHRERRKDFSGRGKARSCELHGIWEVCGQHTPGKRSVGQETGEQNAGLNQPGLGRRQGVIKGR